MALPLLDPTSGQLPPGEHDATWQEVVEAFGGTYGRRKLLVSLRRVLDQLIDRGVTEIWIDGSFVTSKERPRDVDVIYKRPAGTQPTTWGLVSPQMREHLKSTAKVDLWQYPAEQLVSILPVRRLTITQFFQEDRDGNPKGIVRLVIEKSET